jgi:cytochrome c-type biogenesis protein CcmF
MPTTEAGIRTDGLSQAYVALGEPQGDGGIAVRLYDKPLILLIWIGAIVMSLGGGLSLTDRRFRLAAPRRARAEPVAAAPQPAE